MSSGLSSQSKSISSSACCILINNYFLPDLIHSGLILGSLVLRQVVQQVRFLPRLYYHINHRQQRPNLQRVIPSPSLRLPGSSTGIYCFQKTTCKNACTGFAHYRSLNELLESSNPHDIWLNLTKEAKVVAQNWIKLTVHRLMSITFTSREFM